MAVNGAPITYETIAKLARDLRESHPFIARDWTFGSYRYVPTKLREAPVRDQARAVLGVPPFFAGGIPFRINPLLEPWQAMMKETNGARIHYTMFDLRRRPVTDDMGQMVDDLRRVGFVR